MYNSIRLERQGGYEDEGDYPLMERQGGYNEDEGGSPLICKCMKPITHASIPTDPGIQKPFSGCKPFDPGIEERIHEPIGGFAEDETGGFAKYLKPGISKPFSGYMEDDENGPIKLEPIDPGIPKPFSGCKPSYPGPGPIDYGPKPDTGPILP